MTTDDTEALGLKRIIDIGALLGRWIVTQQADGTFNVYSNDEHESMADETLVAYGIPSEDAARRMAASADLLKACKAWHEAFETGELEQYDHANKLTRVALALAQPK